MTLGSEMFSACPVHVSFANTRLLRRRRRKRRSNMGTQASSRRNRRIPSILCSRKGHASPRRLQPLLRQRRLRHFIHPVSDPTTIAPLPTTRGPPAPLPTALLLTTSPVIANAASLEQVSDVGPKPARRGAAARTAPTTPPTAPPSISGTATPKQPARRVAAAKSAPSASPLSQFKMEHRGPKPTPPPPPPSPSSSPPPSPPPPSPPLKSDTDEAASFTPPLPRLPTKSATGAVPPLVSGGQATQTSASKASRGEGSVPAAPEPLAAALEPLAAAPEPLPAAPELPLAEASASMLADKKGEAPSLPIPPAVGSVEAVAPAGVASSATVEPVAAAASAAVTRGRGRPRKQPQQPQQQQPEPTMAVEAAAAPAVRGRGRPRKTDSAAPPAREGPGPEAPPRPHASPPPSPAPELGALFPKQSNIWPPGATPAAAAPAPATSRQGSSRPTRGARSAAAVDTLSVFKPAWRQAQKQQQQPQQQREGGQGQGQQQQQGQLAVPPSTSQPSTLTGVAEPLRATGGSAAPCEQQQQQKAPASSPHKATAGNDRAAEIPAVHEEQQQQQQVEAPAPSPRRETAGGSNRAAGSSEDVASFRVVSAVATSSCDDSGTEEGQGPVQPQAAQQPEPGPTAQQRLSEGSITQHPIAVPISASLPPPAPQSTPLTPAAVQPPALPTRSPAQYAQWKGTATAAAGAAEVYRKRPDHPRSAVRVPSWGQVLEAVARTREGLLPSSAADTTPRGEAVGRIRGSDSSSERGGGEEVRGTSRAESKRHSGGDRFGGGGDSSSGVAGEPRSRGRVRILVGQSRGRTRTPPPRPRHPLQRRRVLLSPDDTDPSAAVGGGSDGGSPSLRVAAPILPPGLSNGLLLGEGEVCPDDEEYTTGAAGGRVPGECTGLCPIQR